MNIYKLKLAALALGASTVILPPLAFRASEYYISLYTSGIQTLSDTRHSLLTKVGLTELQPDPTLEKLIQEASSEYNLPPKLLNALISQESAHNSDSYSPKGAIGLAQIMPGNASRCGLNKRSKLWDDRTNIRCGAQILAEELKNAKGNLRIALMTYNGGPLAVKKQYPESIHYANLIMSSFAQSSLS